jgi:K+-sensing histidine kinase KdpD
MVPSGHGHPPTPAATVEAVELTAVAIGAAMLVAALFVLLAARRFAERGYEKQDRYRRQLFDAELSALTRLREANRIREDLVASVSHEFRTPLTAIRGSAATLASHGDKIPPESREVLLRGIVEHADRLGFRLGQARPPVLLEVEPGLAAYVDASSLDQVVRAMADHVQADARRDRTVTLRAGRQGGEIVIDLLYGSTRSETELRELFEPFGSRESAATGRPATLALYVVRRLVEAHGGRAVAARDGAELRVRLARRARRPTADLPVRTSV